MASKDQTDARSVGSARTSWAAWALIGVAAAILAVIMVVLLPWIVRLHAARAQLMVVGSQAVAARNVAGTSRSAPTEPRADQPASPLNRVSATWAAKVATATGIPGRALLAYASADLTIEAAQPACGLGWNTLAAIATMESANGTYGGATLLPSGFTSKPIVGVPLDGGTFGGQRVAAISATGDGTLSGGARWVRAVGPFQFIPSTWAMWGVDATGNGVASPNQIDDAALAAARYLCASGAMTSVAGWRAAVFSYNHSAAYVDEVAGIANRYAAAASGLS